MNIPKKILVMGVGRSGTTAIYSLLQKLMTQHVGDNIDFVYEPFLWKREVFNQHYESIPTEYWTQENSISIDGIYHNSNIPFFCSEKSECPSPSQRFIKNCLTPVDKPYLLSKIIRANGRLPLLQALSPDVKIIYILRNPLDVLNSSFGLFSFFGESYHPSNYEKFLEEARLKFDNEDINFKSKVPDGKELAYWKFMNLSFTQHFQKNNENILPVFFEDYIHDISGSVAKICDFLDIPYEEKFLEYTEKKVGPVTSGHIQLTADNYHLIAKELPFYNSLREIIEPSSGPIDTKKIKAKFENNDYYYHKQHYQITGLSTHERLKRLTRQSKVQKSTIAEIKESSAQYQKELSIALEKANKYQQDALEKANKYKQNIDNKLKLISEHKQHITELTDELNKERSALKENNSLIQQKDTVISRKLGIIESMKKQLDISRSRTQKLREKLHKKDAFIQRQRSIKLELSGTILELTLALTTIKEQACSFSLVNVITSPIRKYKLYKQLMITISELTDNKDTLEPSSPEDEN